MKIKEYSKNNLKFIELKNEKLKLTLCDLGASIFSVIFNNELMIMTPQNEEDFLLGNIYHGKTIGRTGNRIKGNIITIDGEDFKIKNNEGLNTLHGGVDGISTKYFDYKIIEGVKQTKVLFKYTSKNKESGYPGTLKLKIMYLMPENGSKFKIKFEAKTTKPTLCNLTNHSYFIMGEKSLDNISLKVNASNYLECNSEDLLPIQKSPVNKALDFRKYKKITKDIEKVRFGKANGYDHNFYFDEITTKPQVFLKTSNYTLKIRTDFGCCQFYTDNWPNDSIKWVNLGGGTNRSIAVEPQDDFLNRKILRPSEKYSRYISYEFKYIE